VGDIVAGVVRVQTPEGEQAFCVHGGFFQVGPGEKPDVTRATVLAGVAEKVSEIDVARAEAAKEAAEAQLATVARGEGEDDGSRRQFEEALARAQLRLASAT
jgi:F0F1-type ATP synthase epsilon subunit